MTYMKMYVSFCSSTPVSYRCPSLSMSALLAFCFLCYLFCDAPQAISLSTLSVALSLSLVDLAPVSFPLGHLSVCCLFFLVRDGQWLISFSISHSYMLSAAPCMRVNEGTAWVNTQEHRLRWDGTSVNTCLCANADRWAWLCAVCAAVRADTC